jgi:hypothetical protein
MYRQRHVLSLFLVTSLCAAAAAGCSASSSPRVHADAGVPPQGGSGGVGASGGDGGSGGGGPGGSGGSGGQLTGGTGGSAGTGGSGGSPVPADAGAAVEPDAAAVEGGSTVVVTPSGPILLVTGTDPQPAPDNGMKAELTAHNLKFDFVNSDTTKLTDQSAMGHSLIIVSPNTPRSNIPASYRDLPIPIIVAKDGPADQLKMAAPPFTTDPNQHAITIVAPGDPLAAGFPMGNVTIMGPANRIVNGAPSPEAKIVATLVGNPKAAAIYYYDKGQTMLGGIKAPAKRVGLFWHRTADTTPDGRKLFIAAVMWALQP